MIFGKLEKEVEKCKYGQYSLLENKTFFKKLIFMDAIKLSPYFNYNKNNYQGTCSELTYYIFQNFKKKFKNYKLIPVMGNDPKFFNTSDATHQFLILVKNNDLEELIFNDKKNKNIIKNTYIIDPSFNIIEELSKTSYKINRFLLNYEFWPHKKSLILEPGRCSPLFIENKTTFSLAYCPFLENPLYINISKKKGIKKEFEREYNVHDEYLNEIFAESPNLKLFVEKIRKIKQKENKILKTVGFY